MKKSTVLALTFLLFFLSGLVSLIFQVVWLKKLVLVFGNTVWAASTLLTAFMGGLALGSWLFGRAADRVKSPLRLYGILVGIVGAYGLLSLWLFDWLPVVYIPLYRMLGGDNGAMGVAKFFLAALILIWPTTCMGGTLPLLARHFTQQADQAGRTIGLLYTVNTFGAVFGTYLGGFFLIPFLGLTVTALIASGLSLLVFVAALAITPGERIGFALKGLFRRSGGRFTNSWLLWVYLISGFAALSYEIIWNRILVLRLGSSVYAYSVMLTVYLLGLTLGSAIMSHYVRQLKRPLLALCVLQVALALTLVLQIKQFSFLPDTLYAIRQAVGITDESLASYGPHILSYFFGVLQVLILPTVLFGASFPLVVRLYVDSSTELGRETGVLYAFNTIGNILGAFCAGFLILPLLGAQHGLVLTASLNLAVALYVLTKIDARATLKLAAAVVVVIALYGGYALLTQPDEVILTAGIFRDNPQGTVDVLVMEEDVYATVTVEERANVRGTWKQLAMNGVNVAGTSAELFSIQKLQGHLPLLLHPDPTSVLHIGFGSGGTAYAVSRYPVEQITIAEISRSVIEKASAYFQEINHGVLDDPRVNVVFTDGRNRVLADEQQYDVILSDSVHPRFSGNGSLYTYDYYKLLRKRLKPGGLVSQWLPFYTLTEENFKMIIKSFYDVFPNTSVWFPNSTINDYVIVIGKLDDGQIDYATMERKLQRPEVRADLAEIETTTPYKLLDYFLFANEAVAGYVGDVERHTDDNMAVEYMSGRVLNKARSAATNFAGLLEHRASVIPYLSRVDEAQDAPEQILSTIERYERATSHNLLGQKFFKERNPGAAFAEFEKIRSLNPDDLEPVEYFGSSYQEPFLWRAAPANQ